DRQVGVHVLGVDGVRARAVVRQRNAALLELLEEPGRLLLVELGLLEEFADARDIEAALLLTLLEKRLKPFVYDCHAARIPLSYPSPNAVSHSSHKDVAHPRELALYRGIRSRSGGIPCVDHPSGRSRGEWPGLLQVSSGEWCSRRARPRARRALRTARR